EMRAEWDKMSEVLQFLSIDQATKEVFEDVIEARETYGIAYLEVLRSLAGEVNGVEFIDNIPSVQKTAPLSPYVEVEYEANGKTAKRRKKFCKYRQQLNGKTVYFKEIGDPRIMDNRTGDYRDSVPIKYQANELLEFAIGTEPYGEVRWIGTVLNVDGSRKAESLNNRYFSEGRHTPLMILINGGTLTDDSFAKLQGYMNDIKGESGQHAFIVLEAENLDSRTDMDVDAKPNLEVVKMADVLQKDELFQDYLDNNRRKVQSAFQLPDLYVGYTTDFNRATAQSAQEVTEEQVFQPERESLAWVINHKLLADYHFKYVEAYFLEPDISNPDDLYKILTVCNNAGGLTPNKAKSILYKAMGETAEDYEGDWGDVPLAYASKVQSAPASTGFDQQISQQIQKSVENNDVEITAVLKEIRTLLRKNYQKGASKDGKRAIMKEWDESLHPRDENGRFAGGFGGASSGDFANAVADAKATVDAKNAWRVTAHTEEELDEDYPGAALHITSGGSTVAVTSDGDIISVCGNSGDTARGKDLIALAVENGGVKLDSYDGNHGFYLNCGFEPVSWCAWDDKYAPDGWSASRDAQEDIVFYKYTGSQTHYGRAEAAEHLASFKSSTPASADYDAAQSARDNSI
ncbi:MAG: hypothetical protein LUG99_02030, partial [Lachnospiraceae bacterium]|nr:hypothetical protein [Lachnospiraceae bacterium]